MRSSIHHKSLFSTVSGFGVLALWGATAAPISFESTGDGNWRGTPPPIPWVRVSGGMDHAYPIGGDTASLVGGNTISLGASEAVGVLHLANGTLALDGRTLTVNSGGSWTQGAIAGAGVFSFEGSELTLVNSGAKTLGGTLQNAGRIIHSGAGDLVIQLGGAVINAAGSGVYDFQSDAGILAGSGSGEAPLFDNSGLLRKTGGPGLSAIGSGLIFDNSGRVEARSGTLSIDADIAQLVEGVLTGGSWTACTNATLDLGLSEFPTNRASVTLDGVGARFPQTTGLIENQGEFSVIHGAEYLTSGGLRNAGLIFVGSNCTFAVNGDLVQTETGVLAGGGVVNGNVINAGRLAPRGDAANSVGMLRVDNFTQTNSGVLEIAISSDSQHSRLDVFGEATLGGTLEVRMLNGFVPSLGSSFRVMNFATRDGDFTNFVGLVVNSAVFLQPHWGANGLVLLAINRDVKLTRLRGDEFDFSFSFQTVAGGTYWVEYATSLSPANWQLLQEVMGNGGLAQIDEFGLDDPVRFYRVRLQ